MNHVQFIGVTNPTYRPPQKNRALVSTVTSVVLLALALVANFTLSIPKPMVWTTMAISSLSILLFGFLGSYYFKVKEYEPVPQSNDKIKVLQSFDLQKFTLEFFGFRCLAQLACVSKGYNKAVRTLTPIVEIAPMYKKLSPGRADFMFELMRYLSEDEIVIFKRFIGIFRLDPNVPKNTVAWGIDIIICSKVYNVKTTVNLNNNEIEQSVNQPLPDHIKKQFTFFSPYIISKLMMGQNIGEVQGYRMTKQQRDRGDQLLNQLETAIAEHRDIEHFEKW